MKCKEIFLILWNLEICFNMRGRSIFGKFLPLSYLILTKNRVQIDRISSIVYVNNRYIKDTSKDYINQKEIYVEAHIFLIKIMYKKIPVFYITYNTWFKKIDAIINMNSSITKTGILPMFRRRTKDGIHSA